MVDANQIVYQDESYPLEVCAEITYTGSSPVLTTLIKLVYEQSLRWDALIRNGSQVV